MGAQQVPARWVFTCDGCGKEVSSEAKSRPSHWYDVTIKRDAYDFQGAAVADGSHNWLFCEKCTEKVAKFTFGICISQQEIAR